VRETLRNWLAKALGLDLSMVWIPDQTMWVAIGFLWAAIAAVVMARRAGLPLQKVAFGLAASFVGAIVGSRLLGVVIQAPVWMQDLSILLDPRRAPSVSFGALAGGCLAFVLFARRAKVDLWRFADAIVPAAGLGLFFARIGCFVHGCDFGRITALPWAVRYPADTLPFEAQVKHGFVGRYQLESLPVHPFQLYLGASDLLIFLLFWFSPKLLAGKRGERALLAGFLYFSLRFSLEFLRSPYASPVLGLLNVAQWFALLGLCVLYFVRCRLRATVENAPVATLERAAVSEADD